MRFLLLTIEGMTDDGDSWTVAPTVPFGRLPADAMMPMHGDAVELRLPDGRTLAAQVMSLGVSVSSDDEGNYYSDSADLTELGMTLSLMGDSAIGQAPPGTEVWLTNLLTAAPTQGA